MVWVLSLYGWVNIWRLVVEIGETMNPFMAILVATGLLSGEDIVFVIEALT